MVKKQYLLDSKVLFICYCHAAQNTYLPTMPEDMLPQVQKVLNSQVDTQGQFYGMSTIYNI